MSKGLILVAFFLLLQNSVMSKNLSFVIEFRAEDTLSTKKSDFIDKSYYDNGKIKAINSYKNGLLHGVHISFRENGSILIISEFKNGKKDGDFITYSENGRPIQYAKFRSNKMLYQCYYNSASGQIVEEWEYNDDGKLTKHRFLGKGGVLIKAD